MHLSLNDSSDCYANNRLQDTKFWKWEILQMFTHDNLGENRGLRQHGKSENKKCLEPLHICKKRSITFFIFVWFVRSFKRSLINLQEQKNDFQSSPEGIFKTLSASKIYGVIETDFNVRNKKNTTKHKERYKKQQFSKH